MGSAHGKRSEVAQLENKTKENSLWNKKLLQDSGLSCGNRHGPTTGRKLGKYSEEIC